MTPICVYCKKEIKWYGVEDGREVYKCECGLSDHTEPVKE